MEFIDRPCGGQVAGQRDINYIHFLAGARAQYGGCRRTRGDRRDGLGADHAAALCDDEQLHWKFPRSRLYLTATVPVLRTVTM
jgi:hypothetical protein